jgi:phospholipid/cholesterol/gamma-HCH transport system substrate-binding protein
MAELEIKPTPPAVLRVMGLIACAATFVAILVYLLTGGGARLFAGKVDVRTFLPDATGLEAGAPVRLNGIQVGAVRNIAVSGRLDRQHAVRIGMRLEKDYLDKIPADSITSIGSDTLIGDRFVDIDPGKSAVRLRGGGVLESEPIDTSADKEDPILGLQDSLKKVDTMLAGVASPNTPIGHYVMGEAEYDQLVRSVDTFESSMRSLASRATPMGAAVFTPGEYATWDKSLQHLDDSLQSIQRGEGTMGRVFVSDDQYNSILNEVKDLRKSMAQFRADMTKMGPQLRDEEAYRKITRMLKSTDDMLASLNRGEGQVGELLTNPQMYESLVGALNNLQEFLKDFDAHPQKYLRMKALGSR